jgi:signal peptidase I
MDIVVVHYHIFFYNHMFKTSIKHYLINNTLTRKLLFTDRKGKRSKFYLERFREHKQSSLSRNIVVQLLPVLVVLAIFYILYSQNLFFGTVLSGSMEPTFKRGDLVLMQSLYGEPRIGDIIMFVPLSGMEPVTHRIISIDQNGYIRTKGDANQREDDWRFSKGNIIGKSVIIGNKPVVIPGLGSTLVSRAENFTIIRTATRERAPISLFQEFRTLAPLLIFFMLIIYIFKVFETSNEEKQRFTRNGRKKQNEKGN